MTRAEWQHYVHAVYKRLNATLFDNRLPTSGPALSLELLPAGTYAQYWKSVNATVVDVGICAYGSVDLQFTRAFLTSVILHEMLHYPARPGRDHGWRFWRDAVRLSIRLGYRIPWPWDCRQWPLAHQGRAFHQKVKKLLLFLVMQSDGRAQRFHKYFRRPGAGKQGV